MARKRKSTKRKQSNLRKKALKDFNKAIKGQGTKKLRDLIPKSQQVRVDPLWDLERDGVTYSILNQFQNCRHRLHINKVQGWQPKRINFPMEFGSLFHLLLEASDQGHDDSIFTRIVDNYILKRTEGKSADVMKEASLMGAVVLVTHRQYVAYWDQNPSLLRDVKHVYEKDFGWIEKEKAFEVEYRMSTGRKVKLRGKRDGVFKIPGENQLILKENKTKGQIDADGLTQGLHKDMQTMLYILSMFLEFKSLPWGLLYDVIRRTSLKPRVADTPASFAERVEADIVKRPDFYFMRWTREINQDEIHDFCTRQLDPLLYQITTWWDSIKRKPMDPFNTYEPCGQCLAYMMRNDAPVPTGVCDCTTLGRPNVHHYERPFGSYDSVASSTRGPFFEIITGDNYYNYQQSEHANPELEVEDSYEYYL